MPVENQDKYTYYRVNKEKKIECTSKGSNKGNEYDLLWGELIDINRVQDSWEGKPYHKFELTFRSPINQEIEILQIREGGSAARGLMFSLYSIPGTIRQVRIKPYEGKDDEGNKYTNLSLAYRDHESQDWQKIPEWPEELINALPPPKEYQLPSGRSDLDYSEQIKYIQRLFVRIKKQKIRKIVEVTSKDSPEREMMDTATGEVIRDGRRISDDLYKDPEPTLPPPAQQAPPVLTDDFDDMDDDLPF